MVVFEQARLVVLEQQEQQTSMLDMIWLTAELVNIISEDVIKFEVNFQIN